MKENGSQKLRGKRSSWPKSTDSVSGKEVSQLSGPQQVLTKRRFDADLKALHVQLIKKHRRVVTKAQRQRINDFLGELKILAKQFTAQSRTAIALDDPRKRDISNLSSTLNQLISDESQLWASDYMEASIPSSSPLKAVMETLWQIGSYRAEHKNPKHLATLISSEFVRLKLETHETRHEAENVLREQLEHAYSKLVKTRGTYSNVSYSKLVKGSSI